jgi:hypothetical protein
MKEKLIRIPEEIYNVLVERSKANRRSISAEIIYTLEREIRIKREKGKR